VNGTDEHLEKEKNLKVAKFHHFLFLSEAKGMSINLKVRSIFRKFCVNAMEDALGIDQKMPSISSKFCACSKRKEWL